jgi:hypothetical protein
MIFTNNLVSIILFKRADILMSALFLCIQLRCYLTHMDSEELSEDEILDLTSDSMFLESLLQEMRKALAIPVAQVF